MKKFSTEPYKGTRDFYPEDMFIENYIWNTWRQVCERFGYVEYGASLLEDTQLYRAKSGEEIVNEQTYSFTDRGGRDITLRPEMTPSVARMVARRRKELVFPLRWYTIPNLFRYERPQRGRLREHWQLNCDLFGVDGVQADAEIIIVAYELMRAFGAKEENFIIRVNNRLLMNYFFHDIVKLSDNVSHELGKLIDRKDKMKSNEFVIELERLVGKKSSEVIQFLENNNLDRLRERYGGSASVNTLESLCAILDKRGVKNVVFSPTLMRGFDYYTGVVFEVFDVSPNNRRSLFGGGRYDDLVSIFGVEKVAGLGFGMGDVTIRDYMETYNLLPKYVSPTQLSLCVLGEASMEYVQMLAKELRNEGVNVNVDISFSKLGAQVKTAARQGIPYVVCIGEEEVQSGKVRVKHLSSGQEKVVTEKDLADFIKRESIR